MKKIFITGASGCVGSYVLDVLSKHEDFELYLLLRTPGKIKLSDRQHLVHGDLQNIEQHKELLRDMDYVVHIAAGWGNIETNFDHTLKLFKLLNLNKCQKIIYFSTASILGSDNLPHAGIEKMDASYVNGKYLLYKNLPKLAIHDKVVTLFPTWVIGGDKNHPHSHAAQGILGAKKWLWLLKWLSLDVSFHFIHAQDMALIVEYLLEHDTKQNKYILGNDLVTADQLVDQICAFFGHRTFFKFKIPVELILKLFDKRLADWDRYCLQKRHFNYNCTGLNNFGLSSKLATIPDILKSLFPI